MVNNAVSLLLDSARLIYLKSDIFPRFLVSASLSALQAFAVALSTV